MGTCVRMVCVLTGIACVKVVPTPCAAQPPWALVDFGADDFRVFCGDLGNEVSDEGLTRAFSKYPSMLKAHVCMSPRLRLSRPGHEYHR